MSSTNRTPPATKPIRVGIIQGGRIYADPTCSITGAIIGRVVAASRPRGFKIPAPPVAK